jgi:hypothetical protein
MNHVRPLTGWLMLALASLVVVFLDQLNSLASFFNTGTAAFRRAEYALFLGSVLLAVVFFALRRWLSGTLVLVMGTLLPFYLWPLVGYVNSLGRDSFAELHKIDWTEARFYLSTMQSFMQPGVGRRAGALYVALTALVLLAVYVLGRSYKLSRRSFNRIHAVAGITLIGWSFTWVGVDALSPVRFLWQTHEQLVENFRHPLFALRIANTAPKLVIYIGESTSSMNMSLYGYPRETSPALLNLQRRHEGLLVFDNVLSTHTHTAPSLLEALSVPMDSNDHFLDIYSRRRISLIPILKASGVRTHLISNQGSTGFFNVASSIIFGEADSRKHSISSRRFGDSDYRLARPFDHEFLLPNLAAAFSEMAPMQPGVVFLHSYAGHGPYLSHIPHEYRDAVDDYLRHGGMSLVDGSRLAREVESYDSTLRYIDSVVSGAIEAVARVTEPVVFIYFSDHGESVYTGRGHDSAQYIHEMVRVPFVMYFNEAAIAAHPALFGKYAALSAQRHAATLAQLPSTILDLLGADIRRDAVSLYFSELIGENSKGALGPIVVRKVGDEIQYVPLSPSEPPGELRETFVEATDAATRTFAATRRARNERPGICYRTSEKLVNALRGALVADCIQIDVSIDKGGQIAAKATSGVSGIPLRRFEAIAEGRGVGLWLFADGVRSGPRCQILHKHLSQRASDRTHVLVEFTAPAEFDDKGWLNCVNAIQRRGLDVVLRLDAAAVQKCSGSLGVRDRSDPAPECESLRRTVQAANDEGFDRFSFDYTESLALLPQLDSHRAFRWIARRFELRALEDTNPDHVEMVMVDPEPAGK